MSHIRNRRRLTAHFKLEGKENRVILSPSRKQTVTKWVFILKREGKIVYRTSINRKAAAIVETIMYGKRTMVYS